MGRQYLWEDNAYTQRLAHAVRRRFEDDGLTVNIQDPNRILENLAALAVMHKPAS